MGKYVADCIFFIAIFPVMQIVFFVVFIVFLFIVFVPTAIWDNFSLDSVYYYKYLILSSIIIAKSYFI